MRTKCVILLLFTWIYSGQLNAQSSYKSEIYQAFISGDMVKWKHVLDKMDKIPNKNNEQLLQLVNFQYGYIGWCLGVKREKEAATYLNKAESHLSKLEKQAYQSSTVLAYKSLFLGFQIMQSPIKATLLGMKCLSYSDKAYKLDNKNVFATIQQGNLWYYKPKILGGSVKEALVYYHKAEKLMEAGDDENLKDWNYLNLLATIAKSYQLIGQPKKQAEYIQKALKVEPDFSWIKSDKRPALKVDM